MPTVDQLARLAALEGRKKFVRRVEFSTHGEIAGLIAELDAARRLDPRGCVLCVPVKISPQAWEARTRAEQLALARDERTPVAEGQGAALRGLARPRCGNTPKRTPQWPHSREADE